MADLKVPRLPNLLAPEPLERWRQDLERVLKLLTDRITTTGPNGFSQTEVSSTVVVGPTGYTGYTGYTGPAGRTVVVAASPLPGGGSTEMNLLLMGG